MASGFMMASVLSTVIAGGSGKGGFASILLFTIAKQRIVYDITRAPLPAKIDNLIKSVILINRRLAAIACWLAFDTYYV